MSSCPHCSRDVDDDAVDCSHCGMPLPPHHANQRQRTFIPWFIALVIFCFIMMFWLPPNWTH